MAEELGQEIEDKEKGAPSQERILFFPEPCVNAAGGVPSCKRCAIACPANAISFDDEGLPQVEEALCTLCGICVGICECFAASSVTIYDFAKRLQRKAKEHDTVYLCCKEDLFDELEPARNVVAVECLASLPPELLTYLLATDSHLVLAHDLAYCENCPRGGSFGGKLWQRSFELAQEWAGKQIDSSDVIPEEEGFIQKMSAPDRRGLFTSTIAAAGEVASGRYRQKKSSTVEDFLARRDRMRAKVRSLPKSDVYLDEESREMSQQGYRDRKQLLQEAIDADPTIAGKIPS